MEASMALAPHTPQAVAAETENERFNAIARMAEAWSRSTIIPANYQGKPSNCLVAIEMSRRTGVPVLAVMQNLHVIQGRPSWSATFLIAAANACGRFSPLRYHFVGKEGEESWGCYVSAKDLQNGGELVGETITIGMAKVEGWATKQGSKWKTMPGQMLRYRAATFWARVYAPELTVGFRTADEIEDIPPMSNDRVRDLAADLDAVEEVEVEAEPVANGA